MEYTIAFQTGSLAEKNKWAAALADKLRITDGVTDVKVERESSETMDLGSVLTVVLSSGATLAVARGIQTFLTRYRGAMINIQDKGRKIKVGGVSGKDAARILEILQQDHGE